MTTFVSSNRRSSTTRPRCSSRSCAPSLRYGDPSGNVAETANQVAACVRNGPPSTRIRRGSKRKSGKQPAHLGEPCTHGIGPAELASEHVLAREREDRVRRELRDQRVELASADQPVGAANLPAHKRVIHGTRA